MTTFTPATKDQARARIALCGPSGSGKTYTALALAHELGTNIAVIDSERGSASKYVGTNGWAFNTLAPSSFAPASLIDHLADAAAEAHDVTIVDSLSHYWMGVDGMLEQVDRHSKGGGNFGGWKEERPNERRMIDALIAYPGHVIVTMRVKTEYVIEEDDRGKKVPRKVGLRPEQRDGIEYEFDLVGDLSIDNVLTVSKSRIPGLNRAVIDQPGAELAGSIRDWLATGEPVPDARGIRDAILAAENTGDLLEHVQQMDRLQLRNAAVVDATGQRVSLYQLTTDRWSQLNAADQTSGAA
jgi:DNA polymerase III delta prime subunit